MERTKFTPQLAAISALMIALTTVFTLVVRVPVPASGGYINLSDVAITFAALTFGPVVGFLAGGIGAGLADIIGGYAQWAPLTLIAHGVEGLLIGYIGYNRGWMHIAIGWLVGGLFMVLAYFVGEVTVMGIGWSGALTELPGNLIQMFVGGLVGIPLMMAVRKAYPPIVHLASGTSWHE